MSLTKQQIKDWLWANGKNREWLAEQCKVSKRTVSNWLSTNISIPARALVQIDKLMKSEVGLAGELAVRSSQHNLVLEVDIPTFERWSRAALNHQEILTEYAHRVIEEAAAKDLSQNKIQSLPKAAEDAAEYGHPKPKHGAA